MSYKIDLDFGIVLEKKLSYPDLELSSFSLKFLCFLLQILMSVQKEMVVVGPCVLILLVASHVPVSLDFYSCQMGELVRVGNYRDL